MRRPAGNKTKRAPGRSASPAHGADEEAQHLLAEAFERYTALFDFLPLPLLTLDRVGLIREVSQATLELFSSERNRLLGMPLTSLVVKNDRTAARKHVFQCRRAAGGAVTTELSLSLPAGGVRAVQLVSRRTTSGPEAYWTALVDVTEEKQAHAERQRLQELQQEVRRASEAKDLFISVLSHELRSPLTAIAAVAGTLEQGDINTQQRRELGRILRRNALAQSRLIDDLGDLTRVMRKKLRIDRAPTDLRDVVRDILGTLASDIAARKLAVSVELGASHHVVLGDEMRLRQVFWNLIHNALKFTPAGGSVGVRSWNTQGRVIVEVSDTGAGIEEAELERLFQPFEQGGVRASVGLGLGLPIAKGIVELHGGAIFVASAGRGRGARFLVELATLPQGARGDVMPVVRDSAVRLLPAMVPEKPARIARRILLVEDNPDIAQLLSGALGAAGYHVEVAASIQSALSMDHDVDVLLSDLQLPDGSGLELVRRLRRRRNLTAIALSGYGSPDDVRASRDAGFSAHLKKPIDTSDLVAAIEAVLSAPRESRRRLPGRHNVHRSGRA
jgi:PAS domain S-box-containing protein